MQGNAALEVSDEVRSRGFDRSAMAETAANDLHDAWFDAPPPSAVRPRTIASDPPPPSRRSARPAGETEIDALADSWFR